MYKFIFSKWLWKEWYNNTKIIKKMKKLHCVICGSYRKFEKSKMSFLLEKTLVISIILNKCKNEDEKYLKKKKNQLKC